MKPKNIDLTLKKIPAPTIRFENKALLKQKTATLKRSTIIWITCSAAAAMVALILTITNFNTAVTLRNNSVEILAETPITNTITPETPKSISTEAIKSEPDNINQIRERNERIVEPKTQPEQSTNDIPEKSENISPERVEGEIKLEDLVSHPNLASGIEQRAKVIVLTHTIISDISSSPSPTLASNDKNRRARLIDFSKNETSQTQKPNRLKRGIRTKNEEFWGIITEKTDKLKSLFNAENRDRKPLILIAKE